MSEQSFFIPIQSNRELDKLFAFLAAEKTPLQVKIEKGASLGEANMTTLKGYNFIKTIMLARHVAGPHISQDTNVTIVIDLPPEKYFCSGKVVEAREYEYVVSFEKVFKLQRRNSFRVTIPEKIVAASFVVTSIKGKNFSGPVRVMDLSAGGVALELTDDLVQTFSSGAEVAGNLKIGDYETLPLKLVIKYRRKMPGTGRKIFYHCGCEFLDASTTTTEKISNIVTDCHRQIFLRFKP